MDTDRIIPPPAFYDITPLIATELIQIGKLKLVRATVTIGPMKVTSFSDVIYESSTEPFQRYAQQAAYRAMELILRG